MSKFYEIRLRSGACFLRHHCVNHLTSGDCTLIGIDIDLMRGGVKIAVSLLPLDHHLVLIEGELKAFPDYLIEFGIVTAMVPGVAPEIVH